MKKRLMNKKIKQLKKQWIEDLKKVNEYCFKITHELFMNNEHRFYRS